MMTFSAHNWHCRIPAARGGPGAIAHRLTAARAWHGSRQAARQPGPGARLVTSYQAISPVSARRPLGAA
jgi:hypothetical protein